MYFLIAVKTIYKPLVGRQPFTPEERERDDDLREFAVIRGEDPKMYSEYF